MKPAIVCDVDGTLAHHCDRGIFEFHKAGNDKVDTVVRDILQVYSDARWIDIIIVSAREDKCRDITIDWLHKHNVPFNYIHMRKTGDFRKDDIVKREIYEEHIKPFYDVQFVLDDRDQVVKMWREIGLKCLQVADGNF